MQSSVSKASYIAGKSHVFWMLLINSFIPTLWRVPQFENPHFNFQRSSNAAAWETQFWGRQRKVNVILNPSVTYSVERRLEFRTVRQKNCHVLFEMARATQNPDILRNDGLPEQSSNLFLAFASRTIFLFIPRPLICLEMRRPLRWEEWSDCAVECLRLYWIPSGPRALCMCNFWNYCHCKVSEYVHKIFKRFS